MTRSNILCDLFSQFIPNNHERRWCEICNFTHTHARTSTSTHVHSQTRFGCVSMCILHECSTSLCQCSTQHSTAHTQRNTLLRSIVLSRPIAWESLGYLCRFLYQALVCALTRACVRVRCTTYVYYGIHTQPLRLMFMHVMWSSYISIPHNSNMAGMLFS